MIDRLKNSFRLAYLPILATYFAFGAGAITAVATLFLQKNELALTPSETAVLAFWTTLPWSLKMVFGGMADALPVFGSKRGIYLGLGALLTMAAYLAIGVLPLSKESYLGFQVVLAAGLVLQDVIADALTVEVAESEKEQGNIQVLGRIAVLAGGICVSYLGAVLTKSIGAQKVFLVGAIFPALVLLSLPFLRRIKHLYQTERAETKVHRHTLIVISVGVIYAVTTVAMRILAVPYAAEITLIVSMGLLWFLLVRLELPRPVLLIALIMFVFRAMPGVGDGFNYWSIDTLGFDEEFLGMLTQASAVVGFVGLLGFRKKIAESSVTTVLTYILVLQTVLSLPAIGLFYGLHEVIGISAKTLMLVDTAISAPLGQISIIPMLVLIARCTPEGAEATMFATMASWLNIAVAAGGLFTQYLNNYYGVSQGHYESLGELMIVATLIGLLPLVLMPILKKLETDQGKVA